jgi:hypothetical protein
MLRTLSLLLTLTHCWLSSGGSVYNLESQELKTLRKQLDIAVSTLQVVAYARGAQWQLNDTRTLAQAALNLINCMPKEWSTETDAPTP